eukprot:13282229-Alexandrium_andersonii.AAC.1
MLSVDCSGALEFLGIGTLVSASGVPWQRLAQAVSVYRAAKASAIGVFALALSALSVFLVSGLGFGS